MVPPNIDQNPAEKAEYSDRQKSESTSEILIVSNPAEYSDRDSDRKAGPIDQNHSQNILLQILCKNILTLILIEKLASDMKAECVFWVMTSYQMCSEHSGNECY